MTEQEFDAITQAQQDAIDRSWPEGELELYYQASESAVLCRIVPTDGSPIPRTFLLSGYNDDGDMKHQWAEEVASELFLQYMTSYIIWTEPTVGAVSPTLSEFFAYCDEGVPAQVNWARWLRLEQASDEGLFSYQQDDIEDLVEAMIRSHTTDSPTLANLMRRAVRGEPVGERDPNQLNLF
jgi:hypothetical protein